MSSGPIAPSALGVSERWWALSLAAQGRVWGPDMQTCCSQKAGTRLAGQPAECFYGFLGFSAMNCLYDRACLSSDGCVKPYAEQMVLGYRPGSSPSQVARRLFGLIESTNHSAPKPVICKHFAPSRNGFLGFSLGRHIAWLNVPLAFFRR